MDAEEPADGPRPSWQREPCPDWCTREHREDDHPEDRVHRDAGVSFPAVLARVDPVDLRRTAVATEIVVQRSQDARGDPQVWVIVGEADGAVQLTLALESVARLRAGLP